MNTRDIRIHVATAKRILAVSILSSFVSAAAAVEPEVKLWDIAPLDVIVREAGGAFTSIDGARGPHGGSALATNGRVHDQVLGRLNTV